MSISLMQNPAGQASRQFYKLCAQVLQPAKRHQSSYRRSRSRLNVKPDASFLPSKTETHDHIIFNPPPSMPNVYHTPTIFLPKSDKRRQLQEITTGQKIALSGTNARQTAALPPPVTQPYEKRYHLTEAQIREMRDLRMGDPWVWSASKLAQKFDCSPVFVNMVIQGLAPEKAEAQKKITEVIRSRWGVKRRVAREDRLIRKERWFRDG